MPEHLRRDPDLWSGCISGALTEDGFLAAFERAGFHGIRMLARQGEPWRTVEGIEFRSVTVEAFKGKQGPCFDHGEAVIYRGPFREVLDDDGHRLPRGARIAVCRKTFELYSTAPYREHFELVDTARADSARPGRALRLLARRAPRPARDQGRRLPRDPRNVGARLRSGRLLLSRVGPDRARARGAPLDVGCLTVTAPRVHLASLDTLWFQVAGTLCNLACTHCFVSCSPTNRTHEMLSLATVLGTSRTPSGSACASTTSPAASPS